jgi:anthranilate synthase component 1
MEALKVVTKERLADTETPVSAFHKLCRGRPDAALLESVEPHESVGRYSIVALDPLSSLELWSNEVRLFGEQGETAHPARDFFSLIRQTLATLACQPGANLPSVGSLLGYIAYDAVRLIERLGPPPDSSLPMARLFFPSRFVLFDHRRRVMTLVGIGRDEKACQEKISETERLLGSPVQIDLPRASLSLTPPPKERFMKIVRQAKEYIRAGDIFQVVLADRFDGRTDLDPFDAYRFLRVRSPSPYMFFLQFNGFTILGASPETLVKVKDGSVYLRPIAGTRGRFEDPEEDRAAEKELMDSEKEKAEHVMLVDLGRNDAGRVSEYGSVIVQPYMIVERYSHVMHIVSQVKGRLRSDADAVDAFMAGFPAGTVSGAPKVRAMEIIDELEEPPRGPYAGAVGYFGPGNEMDTCIAIRMVLFEGRNFSIPVGAGIVADSDPEMEYQEISDKAAQSVAALETAARGES